MLQPTIPRILTKSKLIIQQVKLKSTIDYSKVPKLNEADLEEKFIRGSGPGGSNTNKNSNCCELRHIPTGIIVKCHETRKLHDNRKRAREILTNKLDNLLNGVDSIEAQKSRIAANKSISSARKKAKFKALKDEWLRRENIKFK